MPARIAEIHHAKQEGIEFHLLCNPSAILSDETGFVRAIRCIRMELGAPDDSGRRRPVPVKDSDFEIECDVVIIAIGNNPNPLIGQTTPDIAVSKMGDHCRRRARRQDFQEIRVCWRRHRYRRRNGDISHGAGKIAARSILADLL